MKNILLFSSVGIKDIKEVGGKVSSLGEMYSAFKKEKINVPAGFCVTSSAFRLFIGANNLKEIIRHELSTVSNNDIRGLEKSSKKIQNCPSIAEGRVRCVLLAC